MAVEPDEVEKGCLHLLLVWGGVALGALLLGAAVKALLIYLLLLA